MKRILSDTGQKYLNADAKASSRLTAQALLPRTVVVLGLVSFLNDAASEMVTPLLPIFLTATLGAGPAIVGLVEGLAEATASVLKLVSGRLADRGVRAKALVVGGYALSNATRPLIGLAMAWSAVLALRFLDRVGKGIRTAPRDALIAGAVPAAQRGRAFGFHRSMDHAGAVVGPLVAFALLSSQVDLGTVFLASVVPGALVLLLLVFGVPAGERFVAPPRARFSWRALHARLRAMIVVAGGLALASVPEVFVVLWATQAGMEVKWIPLVWAAASLAKMLIALPAGIVSDRLGRTPVLLTGWSARVVLLALLATWQQPSSALVWLLFVAYSATLAITEPAERSLIGDHAAEHERGTAYGLYHLASGLLVLPGAVLFGALWQGFGSGVAFGAAATITAVAAMAMLGLARPSTSPAARKK
ncbi:MAG TPA: MFS transporter [Steroidobacteraceae bacterium]|nr:MFS transporter [Steroidobacteraceae bacterium]